MMPAGPDGSVPPVEPIERICAYLRAETAALRGFAPVDLERGIQIKSQALLELTRHARLLAPSGANATLRRALNDLRAELASNQAAVALHLDAARKVSDIIIGAMEREASDQTYSASSGRTLARAS